MYEEKEKKKPDIVRFSRFDDAVIYIRRNIRSRITIENLANYMRLDAPRYTGFSKRKPGFPRSSSSPGCAWKRPVKCWIKPICL